MPDNQAADKSESEASNVPGKTRLKKSLKRIKRQTSPSGEVHSDFSQEDTPEPVEPAKNKHKLSMSDDSTGGITSQVEAESVSHKSTKKPFFKNSQTKIQDILMILVGFLLIVVAALNLVNLNPFLSQQQNEQVTPVVDQQGFAPIFIPKEASSEQISVDIASDPTIPSRILIDKIGLDAPVKIAQSVNVTIDDHEVTQYLVPEEFAAGWHEGSAPLGEPGNTVISGHHNAYGEVFKNLVELENGDSVKIFSGNKTFEYIIANKMILSEKDEPLEVRIENARWILRSDDERLTLVTCWPARSNTHRLILVAVPAPKTIDQTSEKVTPIPTRLAVVTSSVVDALPILTTSEAPIVLSEDQIFEVINSESLSVNIRDIPNTTGEILGKLASGKSASGIGRTADGSWIFIKMDDISGWVSAELVEIRIPSDVLPTIMSTSPAP